MEEQWSVPAPETSTETSVHGDNTEVPAAADPAATDRTETAASTAEETPSPSEADTVSEEMPEADAYLPVYNGKVCPVKADDRQEITTLLQLGMKQRDFLPSYERLTRMARDLGMPSVKTLIDGLCDAREEGLLKEALDAYGEENGRRFYELERAERERRYEAMVSEQEAQTRAEAKDDAARLAEQFSQLVKAYPHYHDIRELPQTVVQTALQENISLLDAHNRYVLAEQQRQKSHAAHSAQAAAQSTGSLAYNATEVSSAAMDAFLSGLHRRA